MFSNNTAPEPYFNLILYISNKLVGLTNREDYQDIAKDCYTSVIQNKVLYRSKDWDKCIEDVFLRRKILFQKPKSVDLIIEITRHVLGIEIYGGDISVIKRAYTEISNRAEMPDKEELTRIIADISMNVWAEYEEPSLDDLGQAMDSPHGYRLITDKYDLVIIMICETCKAPEIKDKLVSPVNEYDNGGEIIVEFEGMVTPTDLNKAWNEHKAKNH